jgi:hypothetical protein
VNAEIGSTLINGYALNRALSVIYTDLRDTIETNSVASKYVFADISQLSPEFNTLKKYPIGAFKTFTNVSDTNIKNIGIIPAISYDIKRAGIVTLVDVTTMTLKGLGLVKSADLSNVEILWLEYIAQSKQLISSDAGNLITIGTDGRLYLSKEAIEQTENKVYCIDDDIKIVGVYRTYLDYNPADIKKLEGVHDGAYVVIIKDPLHDNKTWLYQLSNVSAAAPTITPIKEYTKVKEYPSAVAVKSYVDSKVINATRNFDKDTIVKNPNSELWGVAFDRHTIAKNKSGLYAVDLDVLKRELLQVSSTPGNVVVFDQNGYIRDDGWGITSESEAIDDGAKKLVSKKFLNSQRITDNETSDLINSADIKK